MSNSLESQISEYIDAQSQLDMLRFITCGSVDDGKSTLIGRMLYEAQQVFDDQISSLQSDSQKHGTQGDGIDFALLVDGLAAEREQGITIDVAYRFFSTPFRKFIVADTPGHEEYTRNMVTGASTAELAIILVDASQGVLLQTQRHSFIASLLGIKNVVLAINKMDLVEYSETIFAEIDNAYRKFSSKLDFDSVMTIPLSALNGDNVVERSTNTPWYKGAPLLKYLETVVVQPPADSDSFRMPVQWVNRYSSSFRGYAGTVASGSVEEGSQLRVLPSGQLASVESVFVANNSSTSARNGDSITLTLDRDIDISRGDVLVRSDSPCEVSDQFEVTLVWMNSDAGYAGRAYYLMLGTSRVSVSITDLKFKYNVNTLDHISANDLHANEIAVATVKLDRAIPFTTFKECKGLGSFILIDKYSFSTVAAGMISFSLRRADNIHHQSLVIDRKAREGLNGHRGQLLWFTGLSGSGKSTIANALEQKLFTMGLRTYILDGDNVRHGLNKDLGFTDADRIENIRRISEVAKLMVDAGIIVLAAFISPFRSERDTARALFDDGDFIEVHVDAPLDVAENRDPKGLYKKARAGKLPNFTGIDSSYEKPVNAELELPTNEQSVEDSVERILEFLLKDS